MSTVNKALGNFKTLYMKFDDKCTEKHQLFFKEHSIRNQEAQYPRGQTLFLLNVPQYATVESIKRNFVEHCGPVKSVTFNASNGGSKSAYIVFSNDTGLDNALSLSPDITFILNDDDNVNVGLIKWISEHNKQLMIDEESLKSSIEKYMIKYDQQNEMIEEETVDNTEDNDGWTTVSSKKKRGKFASRRKESTIEKIKKNEFKKDKKKKLVNFYTFQIREAKKQQLADLRTKFELDKMKLEKLKSKRTFKPF